LLKIYPKDELGWRWIPIEIRDANFMNIGDKTNELLLKQARQRVSGPVEGGLDGQSICDFTGRAALVQCVKVQSRNVLFDKFLTLLNCMVNTSLPDRYWITFCIEKAVLRVLQGNDCLLLSQPSASC